MSTSRGDAPAATTGFLRWLKQIVKKDKPNSSPVIAALPGSPRATSRKKVAAAEAPAVPQAALLRDSKPPMATAILQAAPSHLRTQTWVTDDAGDSPAGSPRVTESGQRAQVVAVDRLDSFDPPGSPSSRKQMVTKRFGALTGALGPANAATRGDRSVKGKPSGGHTDVEELDPTGTQESFVASRDRNPRYLAATAAAGGLHPTDLSDGRYPRSADDIPRSLAAGIASEPVNKRALSGLEAGFSGDRAGSGPGVWPAPEPPGSPRRTSSSFSRVQRPPVSALRSSHPLAGHSRSRLGTVPLTGDGPAPGMPGSSWVGGAGGDAGVTTTTTKTTTTNTDTTNTDTKNASNVTTTRVTPLEDGGNNVETTTRNSSVQEKSRRQVTHEREVEDTCESDAPGLRPPGSGGSRGAGGRRASGEVGGESSSNWRHRETERRNESYSRRLAETSTEETCSRRQGSPSEAGAPGRGDSRVIIATQREEEEGREEREERETVTENVVGRGGAGESACPSRRHSRTSHVSSQHTTWRMKITTNSHTQLQPATPTPATPPQPAPPPPATSAWSVAPGSSASAGGAAGIGMRPHSPADAAGAGAGAGAGAHLAAGGTAAIPTAVSVAARDPLSYQRQGTLTQRDLVTLSGSQPYLGLESRTDILGRFLDDAGGGIVAPPGGTAAGFKLHPPPMTPSCRSIGSIAAPVAPYHEMAGGGNGAAGRDGRPLSRPGRNSYCPSWSPGQRYSQQPGAGGAHELPYSAQHQQQQSHQQQQQQQRSTTTTRHQQQHTVEVCSSTVTVSQQQQQYSHQQHQQSTTTRTVLLTSHMQEAANANGSAVQQTREETVQETHHHHRQATTTTTTNVANARPAAHGGQATAALTEEVLREAAQRLSGTNEVYGNDGGRGAAATVAAPPGILKRQSTLAAVTAGDTAAVEVRDAAEGEEEEEDHWEAIGGGRKTRRRRRVRIGSAWHKDCAPGPKGSGGGAATDREYCVDTSYDIYAAAGSGGKSFISRSGKSQSMRVSPPRTAGGGSGGAGGGMSYSVAPADRGGGWDPADGDLYDKYDTSSRALAAQAQLMRTSRSRGAAGPRLTVVTSALNPLTWQSAVSPTASGPAGYAVYSAGHAGGGVAAGTEPVETRTGGGSAVTSGQGQAGAAGGPTQTTRRHQSSPGNADIPGLPALRAQHRHDRDTINELLPTPGGCGGGGGGGGGGHGAGITGRANLGLATGLAEMARGWRA